MASGAGGDDGYESDPEMSRQPQPGKVRNLVDSLARPCFATPWINCCDPRSRRIAQTQPQRRRSVRVGVRVVVLQELSRGKASLEQPVVIRDSLGQASAAFE